MATTLLKSVTFSGFESGISCGYTIFNADGTTYAARSTSGIVQPVAFQNTFMALIALPDTCILVWDDGGTPSTYAFEAVNLNLSTVVQVTIVNDDLQA